MVWSRCSLYVVLDGHINKVIIITQRYGRY